LSQRIYSGSAPENEAAFDALKANGIKTIISVDGAKPDIESARRHGLRYVHLPFGYDGVPTNRALALVKAVGVLPGPFYVHCHHGLHRGPAAAAVICMGTEGWTPREAEAWLRLAGTSTNYAGLYHSVRQFVPPSLWVLEEFHCSFPERASVSALAEMMVEIDGRLDQIKASRSASYKRLESDPDLDPAHEALLLQELFYELGRSPIAEEKSGEFRVKLGDAEQASHAFYLGLSARPIDLKSVNTGFLRVTEACAGCHQACRN
jgi:hypothetical protein